MLDLTEIGRNGSTHVSAIRHIVSIGIPIINTYKNHITDIIANIGVRIEIAKQYTAIKNDDVLLLAIGLANHINISQNKNLNANSIISFPFLLLQILVDTFPLNYL